MFRPEFLRKRTKETFGARFEDACISKLNCSRETQEIIQKWMKNPKDFLVYFGSPGIGKTYLCAALYGWAAKNYDTFRYWREGDLFSKIRSSFEQAGDYVEFVKRALDDQFIMIDDIGSSGLTDWRKEIIFHAIDIRSACGYPTVLTSNLTAQEIKEMYGERCFSRIFATYNTIINLHEGVDQRLIISESAKTVCL